MDELLSTVLRRLPEDRTALLEAIRNDATRSALLESAARHATLGIVWEASGGNLGPDTERFRRAVRLQQWAAESVDRVTAEVVSALVAADVHSVVLKGPSLGRRLYGSRDARRTSDVDLLVAPPQLAKATGVLERLGFHRPPTAGGGRGRHHASVFMRDGEPTVDLHDCLSLSFGVPLAAGEFLSRSRPDPSDPRGEVRILEAHDEFLHLCVHAAAHRFEQLSWLFDLKLYAARSDISLARVRKDAGRRGLSAAVEVALALANRRLGKPTSWLAPGVRRLRGRLAVELASRPSFAAPWAHKARSLLLTTLMADDLRRGSRHVWASVHRFSSQRQGRIFAGSRA